MAADSGVTPRNRWNDAVTTPAATWSWTVGGPPSAHGRHRRRTASTASHEGLPSARGGRPPRPWPRLPEAWHPSESNKGLSERLSAPGGKSTRVRRESPSKAPKNGSQRGLWLVWPRRRNWQGVRRGLGVLSGGSPPGCVGGVLSLVVLVRWRGSCALLGVLVCWRCSFVGVLVCWRCSFVGGVRVSAVLTCWPCWRVGRGSFVDVVRWLAWFVG